MTRGISLFAICLGLALIPTMGSLNAMPLGAARVLADAAPANVIQVHGCHRVCRRGPAGWHRHGRFCGRWRC
jgi:hypothetical protein